MHLGRLSALRAAHQEPVTSLCLNVVTCGCSFEGVTGADVRLLPVLNGEVAADEISDKRTEETEKKDVGIFFSFFCVCVLLILGGALYFAV